MRLQPFILLPLLLVFFLPASAQQGGYNLFRSFTVADGLPDNRIYNCVEDNKGFLWVATQGGIARFDGKNFQIFTTRQGLPDNEVLKVVKEKDGTIWVNCFKKIPAYFDEVKNRFIVPEMDTALLSSIYASSIMNLYVLPDGGVNYFSKSGNLVFKNRKLLYYPGDKILLIALDPDGMQLKFAAISQRAGQVISKFFHVKSGQNVDSSNALINSIQLQYDVDGGKFFLLDFTFRKCYRYAHFSMPPIRFDIDSISINEDVTRQEFTARYLNIITKTKKIFVFDKNTLKQLYVFSGNYTPNSLFNDSKGNIWIGTIDKGLLLYKRSAISAMPMPDNFTNTHFLSIARKQQYILAGNYYKEVVKTDGRSFEVNHISKTPGTGWVRKIIVVKDNVFTFSEGGSYVNYNKHLASIGNASFLPIKTAIQYNDSVIIWGAYGGVNRLSVEDARVSNLRSPQVRVTSIARSQDGAIYYGSTNGLYKYNYFRDTGYALIKHDPLLAERIISITATPDKLIWVATVGEGVVILKDDKVVGHLLETNGILSNSPQTIYAVKPGQVWLGTGKGISIIDYTADNNGLSFKIQNLTVNDGLCSNIINEMLVNNDTVYAATGNGIAVIPANTRIAEFDIPVLLEGISINGKDTGINSVYRLGYDKNNIQLQLAGIELGGHFAYFQYRIGKNNWQSIEGNTLNLQLNSGEYIIEVRAVDVNGNIGTRSLKMSIVVATPFWKAIWFWILITLTAGAILVWLLRRRDLAKREAVLQTMLNQKKLTELELQALKSQINPHFIFNCLNSIKFLSHQKKHEEAEKYLDRFAALLRSALEQSSLQQITLQQEIDFIENYLALEKLRLPDKLFYNIEVSAEINTADTFIPSMLLQPCIENAVKHGVAPLKNRQGQVDVHFYLNNNYLIAEVQDNGNGITADVNSNDSTGIGNKNTSRRSSLYNIECSIINLQTRDINLLGTLVQLKIPLKKSNSTI